MMRKPAAQGLIALTIMAGAGAAPAQDREDLTFRRESLGSYNADIRQSSVSGLSAGAYMADQFLVAYSSDVVGAALFAGGPYNCARGNVGTALSACMSSPMLLSGTVIQQLLDTARQRAAAGQIDDLSSLQQRRLYIFSGSSDQTVKQGVTDWVDDWYRAAGMPAANIRYRNDTAAGHALPTNGHGNPCSTASASPWMNRCLDGAGEALQHIYGPLNAPAPVTASSGTFVEFPQNEFFEPAGLSKPDLAARFSFNELGYAYVPAACESGDACRVHVVFHGCKQVYDRNPDSDSANDASNPFGLQMVLKSGFNEWANTNELIVLYPQAQRIDQGNPRGCFDWWGYLPGTASTYATRSGPQMAAVRGMLERVAAASTGGNRPPDVAILSAAQCDHQICLAGRATDPEGDPITALRLRYTDSAGTELIEEADILARLQPDGSFAHNVAWPQDNARYHPVVVAQDQPGGLTTRHGDPVQVGIPCRDWTANNFTHASANRAYSPLFFFGFQYLAVGSDEALGPGWRITNVSEVPAGSGLFRLGGCEP